MFPLMLTSACEGLKTAMCAPRGLQLGSGLRRPCPGVWALLLSEASGFSVLPRGWKEFGKGHLQLSACPNGSCAGRLSP